MARKRLWVTLDLGDDCFAGVVRDALHSLIMGERMPTVG